MFLLIEIVNLGKMKKKRLIYSNILESFNCFFLSIQIGEYIYIKYIDYCQIVYSEKKMLVVEFYVIVSISKKN